jgi:hypothetical protein
MRFSEIVFKSLLDKIESMMGMYSSRASGETAQRKKRDMMSVDSWAAAKRGPYRDGGTYATSCLELWV